MQWLFNGLLNLGQAAVPINMVILGSSLSRGAPFAKVRGSATNTAVPITGSTARGCQGPLLHSVC